ncbi:MAG TPA: SMP-30/gluconolactonase/LRE family protein [Stellaceae bacterium]|nr:SMP-30/gluconolactonase/LRE family protein [Stellaceae bacterium]
MKRELPEIVCAARTSDVLGEVPAWCAREGALYWIDAMKPAIHRFVPASGALTSWTPPQKLGSFALRRNGGFLLASRIGLAVFDPTTGSFEVVANPEADRPNNILNDGRCDRRGRFWVGSMDKMLERVTGRLYRLDPDHSCRVMEDDIWLFNGLCWSPDDRLLYFADSERRAIYAYDFDLDDGVVSNRRLFASTEGTPGVPDGATVDAEGFMWSAQFDSGSLIRYAPNGMIDRVVELPVSRATSCVFGGERLETLYVTSARFRLSEERLRAEPMAGSLLALDVGVRGLPEPPFGG